MKIEWLFEAQCDFRDLLRFYTTQVGPLYARRFSDHVLADIDRLSQFPELGVLRKDTLLGHYGFRALFIGKYVCIYKIVENKVLIYHLVDGRKNYVHHIFGIDQPEDVEGI